MIDDLVIVGADPGASDVPIHYEFEEGAGHDGGQHRHPTSVGAATLTGTTGWSANGVLGKALNLPGGANANAVDLPDNLLQGAADFTTSFWVRPDTKANWIGLFHIGDGLGDAGSFFQIQMQTQAAGQHRPGRHLQGEGQRPPGAGLRHSGEGRGRQPVEPRGLHPTGRRPARSTSTARRSRPATT